MFFNTLPKIVAMANKRLGRGIGSGKGKTSARGQKGQKARGRVSADFTGGGLPLYRKLPFRRGLGNNKISPAYVTVPVQKLSALTGEVNLDTLLSSGIINKRAKRVGVKIVGKGELKNKLIVKLLVTQEARKAIESAGGKVV